MRARQACGRDRQRQRRAILKRDGDNCYYCNLPLGDDATLEHLVDRAHGGPNTIENQALAHKVCNLAAVGLTLQQKIARHVAALVTPIEQTANYLELRRPLARVARTPIQWPPMVRT